MSKEDVLKVCCAFILRVERSRGVECQILQDLVSVLHWGPVMHRITCEILPEHKGAHTRRPHTYVSMVSLKFINIRLG